MSKRGRAWHALTSAANYLIETRSLTGELTVTQAARKMIVNPDYASLLFLAVAECDLFGARPLWLQAARDRLKKYYGKGE